ncbi:MAG TPA: hypothetical protein VNQ81_17035 [Povalibacter sp.]|nr:hypothetical protein [Povalibacter sp.]
MRTRRPFPVALVIASALLWSAAASAQERAVRTTNFQLNVVTSDTDTKDSLSSGKLKIGAAATIPLGPYFGASVAGAYSDVNVRTRDVLGGSRNSCGFNGTEADVALFARRPSLGRVGVSYGLGRLSSDCGTGSVFVETGDANLRTDHYRIDAELYVRALTFALARTSTDLDGHQTLESTDWSTSWYPLDSLRITAFGSDLYDQDSYGLRLDHQPEFLGDVLGVHVGYSMTDVHPRIRTITVGFAYYFGAQTSLKARDREYR